MENTITHEAEVKAFRFHGNGGAFFGILIVNFILSCLTLGIYYPWAKAARLRYIYQEAEFAGNRFNFHGTGKEMFIGMIKAILLIGVIIGVFFLCMISRNPMLMIAGFLFYMAGLILIIPAAIVGGLKYRLSRTSWRGIHFGYRGNVKEMMLLYMKGTFLTIITLGIYGPWFYMDLYRLIISNIRTGNLTYEFGGTGGKFFMMNLVGYLLTIFTLGIYYFWWMADVHNYIFNRSSVHLGESKAEFKSVVKGSGLFKLMIVNIIFLIFTFGLAFPWVIIRTARYYMENLSVFGDLNLNDIKQTETEYKNAYGEGFLDQLDIQLF